MYSKYAVKNLYILKCLIYRNTKINEQLKLKIQYIFAYFKHFKFYYFQIIKKIKLQKKIIFTILK